MFAGKGILEHHSQNLLKDILGKVKTKQKIE
jgi:hypothetical protein